jgi:hypothetical protein
MCVTDGIFPLDYNFTAEFEVLTAGTVRITVFADVRLV